MNKKYIDREKAMEIVKRTRGDYVAAWSEIRQLPAADVVPVVHGEWIPVTEGLPDVNKTKSGYEETAVIVAITGCKKSYPMIYERACIRGKTVCRWKWIWGKIYDWKPITHWMPLPEPPKEDGE